MSRCKACDDVLEEGELIWRTHLNIWEDLCATCRNIVDVYEISFRAKMDKLESDRLPDLEDVESE